MAKNKPGKRPPEGRADSRKPAPKREIRDNRTGADLNFGSRNMAVLGVAVLCILGGFILLYAGSITWAPILLVLGYCVLVPYGLAATQ